MSKNNDDQKQKKKQGQLFFDRDYHIHLGGAIPPSFIANWIRDGHLDLDDQIPDLVAVSSPSTSLPSFRKQPNVNSSIPMITVRQALVNYRGIEAHQLDNSKTHAGFLQAYNAPAYTSLPTFLTLYRAYSRRDLLYKNASQIARGDCAHSRADIRVSIPHPNQKECPTSYAKRALDEMIYYHSCLLPSQKLFITFPRQTFNATKNWEYFVSFVDLLKSTFENTSYDTNGNNHLPWRQEEELAFDFAGQPLPLTDTIPLLDKLCGAFPSAFICYHHGEVCPHIPFVDRVSDTLRLLPYVNRVAHALCLGLAVLGINPDDVNCSLDDGSTPNGEVSLDNKETTLETNKEVAYKCLQQMAARNIGIEISPTCNITLGGARNGQVLRNYVQEFRNCGVNVFVGTDDPGFLGTCLEKEVAILNVSAAEFQ